MEWTNSHRDFNSFLASIIYDKKEITRYAVNASVPVGNIDQSDRAITYWHIIMVFLIQNDAFNNLLNALTASGEPYSKNQVMLAFKNNFQQNIAVAPAEEMK